MGRKTERLDAIQKLIDAESYPEAQGELRSFILYNSIATDYSDEELSRLFDIWLVLSRAEAFGKGSGFFSVFRILTDMFSIFESNDKLTLLITKLSSALNSQQDMFKRYIETNLPYELGLFDICYGFYKFYETHDDSTCLSIVVSFMTFAAYYQPGKAMVCLSGKGGHYHLKAHIVQALIQGFKESKAGPARLTELDLKDKQLSTESFLPLADNLKLESTLKYLNLSHNAIGHPEGHTGRLIGRWLSQHPIETLDLSHTNLTPADLIALAESIAHHPKLKHLDLSHNPLDDAAIQALAQALSQNTQLEHLNLSHNPISSQGHQALAGALGPHPTLDTLNLSHTNIDAQSAQAIGQCLQQNQTLTELNLSHTQLNDAAISQLTPGLKQQKRL